jgi:hypothetical protein
MGFDDSMADMMADAAADVAENIGVSPDDPNWEPVCSWITNEFIGHYIVMPDQAGSLAFEEHGDVIRAGVFSDSKPTKLQELIDDWNIG